MPPLSANEFLAIVAEEQKDPDYAKKLAADQSDSRDINDPAHPESDAYYDAIGDELEKHPIGRRGVRRRE